MSPRAPFTPPILDDHYTFLGLPDFASKDQINGALEDQLGIASSLDNSQPLRSQELRDRIRDIKEDLLTTEAKRAGSDDALRAARRQSASVPAQAPVPPAPASGTAVRSVATLGQPPDDWRTAFAVVGIAYGNGDWLRALFLCAPKRQLSCSNRRPLGGSRSQPPAISAGSI